MVRAITQAVGLIAMVWALGAAAQLDDTHRRKPREPQRNAVWFLKDQPDSPSPTIHVAGEVSTTLLFPSPVDAARTRLVSGEDRFEPLMVSGRSVVLLPLRSLAAEESYSLSVALTDGTTIPFNLVSTVSTQGSVSPDGQVDVHLSQEDSAAVRRSLERTQAEAEECAAVNVQFQLESASVEHALATLLAQDRTDLTPFVEQDTRMLKESGVNLIVITFRRRDRNTDVGKTAVVFQVTNRNPKELWRLDDVKVRSASTGSMKEFAVRASVGILGVGQTARVAVVFDSSQFGSGRNAEHLIVELWREGNVRQAYVELVERDDRPISMKVSRTRAK